MPSTSLPDPVLRLVTWASSRRVLPLLLVLFGVLLWLISFSPFPFSDVGIAEVNGGRGTLDLLLGYGPDQGRELLAALGPEGYRRYDLFQLLDLVFPLSYALSLSGALYALWGPRGWAVLSAIPLVQALVDYTENVLVRVALVQFPDVAGGLLLTTATLTVVKNVLMYTALAAIAAGVAVLVVTRRRRGRTARA